MPRLFSIPPIDRQGWQIYTIIYTLGQRPDRYRLSYYRPCRRFRQTVFSKHGIHHCRMKMIIGIINRLKKEPICDKCFIHRPGSLMSRVVWIEVEPICKLSNLVVTVYFVQKMLVRKTRNYRSISQIEKSALWIARA